MRFTPRAALLALASVASATACSPRSSSFGGPVGQLVASEARASGVSADLMAAIAHVEGGLTLAPLREISDDDAVPVAGVLELRHGRFDSLARGAALTGAPQHELAHDLALGTRAGARVLADLGAGARAARDDLAAWAPVVEELSGHLLQRDRADYRARVFAVLRAGGELPARGGETITLAPHDEIPFELTVSAPLREAQGTPEYAGAQWFDTPQTNKWTTGRGGNPVTMIAIHDTEGGWDASVATLQNDGGKSVHYIIDADGSRVGQFVHESDTAWHAGNWFYNQHMVGIEHVGFAADDAYQTPMYVTSAALVNDIAKRQGLGPSGDGAGLDRSVLVGHQEVPDGNVIAEDSPPCPDSPGSCTKSASYGGASNHRDPGIHWEWCQYMEIVGNGAHCKCNDAYTHFNCVHDLSERVKCSDGVNVEIVHCANDACMVEPIGQDDICAQGDTSAASSSSSSGAGTGGASSSATTGSTTGGGGSVAGGGGQGGAGGQGAGGNAQQHAGCAIGGGARDRDGLGAAAAWLAIAAAVRRRRRAGQPRG
jgi:N-acetyl-anhydromuramyl-L-alanine amidase AmpD